MGLSSFRQLAVACLLLVLAGSAFFVRLHNFENTRRFTIDEEVYFVLGIQLRYHPFTYNAIPYAERFEQVKQRKLPRYMTQPLFKHPPLFPLMISCSARIFGDHPRSAAYVSLFFGSLLIFLTYFLGKLFFDRAVGLLSAFFIWLDPIHIICSQKMWMDTTLAFWMVLAIYFFSAAVKNGRDQHFIWGGVACGLAVLTKYPGILPIGMIALYAMVYKTELFKKKEFWWGLGIPFVMLLPWLFWNLSVYGWPFLAQQASLHRVLPGTLRNNLMYVVLAVLCVGVGVSWWFMRRDGGPVEEEVVDDDEDNVLRRVLIALLAGVFFLPLIASILHYLDPQHVPYVTWHSKQFQHPLFYFRRLTEFSLLYALAFAAFFIQYERGLAKTALLYLSLSVLFFFFVNWGAYQSRYILAATPILMILAVRSLQAMDEFFKASAVPGVRIGGRLFLLGLGSLVVMKTSYINFLISFPNDMCYF